MIVGTGVDVIEIARVERAVAERGERFEQRVFTPHEIEACRGGSRPAPQCALRFAVKEAAMKAVGTGRARGVRWHDIETLGPPRIADPPRSGSLRVALRGRAGEVAAEFAGRPSYRVHPAVSRGRAHGLAFAVLEVVGP